MKSYILTLGLATTILSNPAMAGDSIEDALKSSDVYLKGRVRYEHVDQSNIVEDANASTIRTVIGAKTGEYKGFSAVAEFENITQLADSYNDTINGLARPVVADPEDTAFNQLFLKYSGIDDTSIKLGRQLVTFDDHRFIGSVGWRQNDQTHDALAITNNSIEDTKISYVYSQNVNRIFGTDSAVGDQNGDINLINVSNTSFDSGKLTGYYYSLDFDNLLNASSNTYGASFVGSTPLDEGLKLNYHLEYARQSDGGDNPNSYDADYIRIAPGISYDALTVTGVYEVLGADSAAANTEFETPLATGHKFNGWADQFLGTPAGGLEDIYLDVTYKFSGLSGDAEFLNGLLLKAQYHDFSSDVGSVDFGDEFGLYAKLPIADNYYAEAKYANFSADASGGLNDVEKFTLGFGFNFNLTD